MNSRFLEYPTEAFAYFRSAGIPRVVCEQKHMGSRAVAIVCKDESVSTQRFGVVEGGLGIVYTRTGRRFFDRSDLQDSFLERLRSALVKSGLWEELRTDWVCLDCELMPWSAKAQDLLKSQYAATGAAAIASLEASTRILRTAACRTDLAPSDPSGRCDSDSEDTSIADLLAKFETRQELTRLYIDAYRRYCWPVTSLDDLKLAPFHVLATEGMVHSDKDHQWHMEIVARICSQDEVLLLATPHRMIDVTDTENQRSGTQWWRELTDGGGEGMVVKPLNFVARGKRGLVQPALKCRGREYLRIIYGPEYTTAEHLTRLRSRGLSVK